MYIVYIIYILYNYIFGKEEPKAGNRPSRVGTARSCVLTCIRFLLVYVYCFLSYSYFPSIDNVSYHICFPVIQGFHEGRHSQWLGWMEARGCGRSLSMMEIQIDPCDWDLGPGFQGFIFLSDQILTIGEGLHGPYKERGSLFGEPA